MKTLVMAMASMMLAGGLASCADSLSEVNMEEPVEMCKEMVFDTGLRIGVAPWVNAHEVRQVSRAPLSDCAKVLHCYDFMGDELKQSLTQKTSGEFTAQLRYGDHALRFLAHNSETDAPDKTGTTFAPQKVMDTFLCNLSLAVNAETERNQLVRMKRVVGKVSVLIEDAIPAEVKTLQLITDNHFGVLDMATGYAKGEGAECIRSWDLPSSMVGKTGQIVSVMTFVPADGMDTMVRIEALDSEGKVLHARQVSVPVEVNRCTTAKCHLFSAGEGFAFEVLDEWEPGITIEMEEQPR